MQSLSSEARNLSRGFTIWLITTGMAFFTGVSFYEVGREKGWDAALDFMFGIILGLFTLFFFWGIGTDIETASKSNSKIKG